MNQEHSVQKDPDLVLFSDGLPLVLDGIPRAGWAVTTKFEVLASSYMAPGTYTTS